MIDISDLRIYAKPRLSAPALLLRICPSLLMRRLESIILITVGRANVRKRSAISDEPLTLHLLRIGLQ